ncbi:BTAD domain-containing putative transcriptional regulator [Saccharopolyspora sp. NPDC050389]|uniref:AfsR/SARP family transcriptional regulator n=1 Tax=Saccharopolyspora sp. NPDC050389 TaxID=3155516 RepID=UPI0033F3FD83
MVLVRFEVLGPVRLGRGGGAAVAVPGELRRRLLAMLLARANKPVPADALVRALWPEGAAADRRSRLQLQVHRLRGLLDDPGRLGFGPDGYWLQVLPGELDADRFGALLDEAERADDPRRGAEIVRESLALWRGEPYQGVDVPELLGEVQRLVERRLAALEELYTAEIRCGRHAAIVGELADFVGRHPLRERLHALLMTALYRGGRQADALAAYRDARRLLVAELGIEPGPQLRSLEATILAGQPLEPDPAPARADSTPVSAHRQLPADIRDFCGRREQLRGLHEKLSPPGRPTAVVIRSIEGMGGVGKTRLALHAAHRLVATGRYADVQLYVDLHGHADQLPAYPAAVLASFLRLLGVPGDQIPDGLNERAALYRDRLFGRKALVLLDNAASEDQVLPLLPAGPENLVLITSRRALAVDGSRALVLDAFTRTEAEELLVRMVGEDRVLAEPAAVERVVELCGRLPLAIALVARRMQSRPRWSFVELADRLSEPGNRLAEIAAGTRRLRLVFDLSYRALAADEQRVFRLLGLHPGEDFTAHSVAALADVTPATARRMLDGLADEHLVIATAGDRYRLHDLIAAYATSVVDHEDSAHQQREATRRVLDYYLHTAATAIQTIQPRKVRFRLTGSEPAHAPVLDTREQAEAWLRAERACIIAAITCAADGGRPTHAWQLAHAMWSFFMLGTYYEDWAETHRIGLAAATAAGDHHGQAVMLTWLGGAYTLQGGYDDARDLLEKSLALQEGHDDDLNIITHFWLGLLYHRIGRYPEAVRYTQRSMRIAAALFPHREIRADLSTRYVMDANRDFEQAVADYAQARQSGDLAGEGRSLADLCDACRRLNMLLDALDWGERAVAIAGECGSAALEAHARRNLGALYEELGRIREAQAQRARALALEQPST